MMDRNRKETWYQLLPYLILPGSMLLMAVFAPFLTPQDPDLQNLGAALSAPDAEHLLGTDRYGRDLLSRVIMGSQTTLCTALFLMAFIASAGSLLGALCGYKGGRIDAILMRM